MTKVSVVTGGNKGIGFAIVRGLCKQVGGTVILTARNEARGRAAIEKLEKEGLYPVFELLDITSADSISNFAETIKLKYGGIDILCNNAGIGRQNPGDGTSTSVVRLEKATETMATNFLGTVNVTNALLPLTRKHGRICNVASLVGLLSYNFQDTTCPTRTRLLEPTIREDDLIAIHAEYLEKIASSEINVAATAPQGWYSMSKCLQIAHARALERTLTADPREILINSCTPGFVATDLTFNNKEGRTIDEGAVSPLTVCQLPEGSTNGGFYDKEGKLSDWDDKELAESHIQWIAELRLLRDIMLKVSDVM